MASSEQLVEGYARAVVMVAHVEGVLERVEDELFRFARAVENAGELRERLEDQRLDPATRIEIVEQLLANRAHPQTVAIAAWLVQAGRTRYLADVADKVVDLAVQSRAETLAVARSAVPLEEDQRRRLADALSQSTGQQVSVKVIVDPEVVGGLVVTMGDTVIDGSVARRLAALRSALIGA